MHKLQTSLAYIISVLAHPLLIITWVSAIAFYQVPGFVMIEPTYYLTVIAAICAATFVVPILAIYLWQITRGKIDFLMQTRKGRIIPMGLASITYVYLVFLFYTKGSLLGLSQNFFIFLASTTICLLLTLIITLFYKISAHAVGIAGGFCFLVIMQLGNENATLLLPIILWSLAIGIVLASRLYLEAHNLTQIALGAILGSGVFLIAYNYLII